MSVGGLHGFARAGASGCVCSTDRAALHGFAFGTILSSVPIRVSPLPCDSGPAWQSSLSVVLCFRLASIDRYSRAWIH